MFQPNPGPTRLLGAVVLESHASELLGWGGVPGEEGVPGEVAGGRVAGVGVAGGGISGGISGDGDSIMEF